MFTARLFLALGFSLTFGALAGASHEPDLEQRLATLAERLEEARVKAHVPGMSIAVVENDRIVWARGFGLADVAARRPAYEGTIYGIGSTTKAFTAALVGMLIDEGKASWDDPVTEYLPYFDLEVRSDDPDAECSLRDLLSHRHGFARMSILWLNPDLSREDLLRTAAGAEPWDDFRAAFHYCNVTYLAAGMAAGVAAGSSWDELIEGRLLEPLGMTATTTSVREAREDLRLARGYGWNEVDEEHVPLELMRTDNIGPAGSMSSNVLDMAQWLRLQLGRGEIDGKRLLSTERILETWEPQVRMDARVAYGLGWMLRDHDGRRVVEHGGNVDGFSAEVAFMPDEGLGYVLLMNLSGSRLQQGSLELVFDTLLEESTDGTAVAVGQEVELDDYPGLYVANFGPFRDDEFEIRIDDDRLALDIPGQQSSDLEHPDADGMWLSTVSRRVAVSFQRDDGGAVVGLTVHQGEFHFEVPRKGIEVQPEVPVETLEKYVGTYVRAEGGKHVKLFVERGRLTMEDKGNHLAFHTPGPDGHAPLRARTDQGATFEVDAGGNVDSFIYHGNAGDKLFTRLSASELPSLEDVLALRRTEARIAAMVASGGVELSGKVWVAQSGVRGSATVYLQGTDKYANHLDFGRFGRIDVVADGDQAWSYTPLHGFDVLKGDELIQALLEQPGAVEGDWRERFDSVEVVRNDSVDGRPVHVVRLEKGHLPSRTYWIDAESGDLVRVNRIAIEDSARIPVMTTFSEFEEHDGLRRAMRVEIENPASGRTVLTFEKIASRLELHDEVFTIVNPDPDEQD